MLSYLVTLGLYLADLSGRSRTLKGNSSFDAGLQWLRLFTFSISSIFSSISSLELKVEDKKILLKINKEF